MPLPELPSDRTTLGEITLEHVKAASLSFPAATSTTVDGMHPRHFALLCPLGLRVVALLLMIIESSGVLPAQVALLTVVLIPKGPGKKGWRPIMIFAAIYRLWGRVRADEARKWLDQHDRLYIASGRGRAPEDAVWRRALEAENRCCGELPGIWG